MPCTGATLSASWAYPGDSVKVLHTLCEDLLMGMRDRRLLTGHIDDATLAALLDK